MAFIFKHLVFVWFCFATPLLLAQDIGKPHKKSIFSERGFIIGAGYGVNDLSLPEGRYTPLFLIGHFGMDLVDPAVSIHHQVLTLFFEPQINPVILQRPGHNTTALELGLNAGLKYMYPVSKKLYVYSLISTGPHVVTVRTERQARGFIFSDNMGAGIYYFVSNGVAINVGMRIRHLSNANTQMPNHGINTMNYLMGISFMIR